MSCDDTGFRSKENRPVFHGGRLREASERYGIPLSGWLDLSTGINPFAYPLQNPPLEVWQRLPETNDGLELAATQYYWPNGVPSGATLFPMAGSQAAIQLLPQIRKILCSGGVPERVLFLSPSYQEHWLAWQRAGFTCFSKSRLDDTLVATADILVVINPNNPTGQLFEPDQLLRWHRQLASRNGWLIVDEAFMDVSPAYSLAQYAGMTGLMVLRSLGKFFGLAGARVGFALGQSSVIEWLESMAGPWGVAGPSRWVAAQALQDKTWQNGQRQTLNAASVRLDTLLRRYQLPVSGGCALFRWLTHPEAAQWHHLLAENAILTRYFPAANGLRFGLPAGEENWQRLEHALRKISA
ncbi:MAG TPA: threonine-phosphate decarboxylase CobD [Pseudomonadales bacterium]|nr:threonine-phosphate decarboxylase CobD [Pseudomonadales bacterium]